GNVGPDVVACKNVAVTADANLGAGETVDDEAANGDVVAGNGQTRAVRVAADLASVHFDQRSTAVSWWGGAVEYEGPADPQTERETAGARRAAAADVERPCLCPRGSSGVRNRLAQRARPGVVGVRDCESGKDCPVFQRLQPQRQAVTAPSAERSGGGPKGRQQVPKR